MENKLDNPFDLTKASDYSDRQVIDFWVDITGGKGSLVDFLKPNSKVPMYLLGGKGSGKTHLLRYCSSAVQNLRANGLRHAIEAEGFLGTYTNADGLNVHRFKGKGQSEEVWETVFAYSFELWLASTFLESLRPALAEVELSDPDWQRTFSIQVSKLFNEAPTQTITTYDDFLAYLSKCRNIVDKIVNNSAISKTLSGIEINFNPGDLIFGLPTIIGKNCHFAKDILFLYLIDEIENFTAQQQTFLNTLVRYRRDNVSFRIGARLYGLKTYNTLGSGEPIKRDAEFEVVFLDSLLRDGQAQYESLAMNLILKRLEAVPSIRTIPKSELPKYFAEINPENYYQRASLDITRDRDTAGKERPHLSRLRKHAERVFGDKSIAETLVKALEVSDHPLLEKTNIAVFFKRLSKGVDVLKLAAAVKEEMVSLREKGTQAAPEYYDIYSHFSSDLLAQLCRDYGQKPIYAGLRTLVRISQGVPRNLLSLLKHIYRRSVFMGEHPFERGPISIDAQIQGINDAAAWFWEDAQPDSHGTLVRNAVENLATLLRTIRYSDNPAECDVCSFKLSMSDLTEDASYTLRMAENWSFLLRINGSSSAKNDDRVLTQLQINPMLAARWGISEARRGVLELKPPQGNAMLTSSDNEAIKREIELRTDGMNLPKLLEKCFVTSRHTNQSGLFDG
jgi:hypothetical protein